MDTFLSATLLLWGAAAIHWVGVIVNVTAPWVYDYHRHMPRDPALRQIFIGQAVWVTLVLAALGALCSFWPEQVLRNSGVALFLLVLWSARLLLQLSWVGSKPRREHPVRYAMFTAAFVYQVCVFGAATIGVLR